MWVLLNTQILENISLPLALAHTLNEDDMFNDNTRTIKINRWKRREPKGSRKVCGTLGHTA